MPSWYKTRQTEWPWMLRFGSACDISNRLYTRAHDCTDIDECLEGNHNCSEYADCENTHREFNCKCYTGYEGDGVICERKKISLNLNKNKNRLCLVSSAMIIGASTISGLVVAITLLSLIMFGSIYLAKRARKVRIRVKLKQKLK